MTRKKRITADKSAAIRFFRVIRVLYYRLLPPPPIERAPIERPPPEAPLEKLELLDGRVEGEAPLDIRLVEDGLVDDDAPPIRLDAEPPPDIRLDAEAPPLPLLPEPLPSP
jgi:hypothetical protein